MTTPQRLSFDLLHFSLFTHLKKSNSFKFSSLAKSSIYRKYQSRAPPTEYPEMDFQFSSTQNRYIKKTNRKRLTQYQVNILEMSFNANQRLQVDCKLELARRLGLPPRQVAVWYQNRRARQKIQTTEVDHKAIQLELDTALAENRRLEQEVGMLKFELNKAQQMLMVSTPSANLLSSLSASDDNDHASSSSPGNMICSWEDAGVLPMEELYSCLISPAGQSYKHNRNDLSIQSQLS